MFSNLKREKQKRLQKAEARKLRSAVLSAQYQDFALNQIDSGVEANESVPIVVSLTTFSERINDVYLAIESLFQQSRKAGKVVLWLSKQDFSLDDIPAVLRKQCKRGLEIELCEKDLGPYTKIYYALKKYPDSLILTVDDDILYPIDIVDQLYRAYQKQPNMIHCHRAHKIRLDGNGRVLPYSKWDRFPWDSQPSRLVFPTGVGGVLYFPGCFDDEVLNQDAFIKLAPNADDVWLKSMSLKKGTLCKKVDDCREWEGRFVVIEGSQKYSLKRKNKQRAAGNDAQIKAVFDSYDLWPLLQDVD